MKKILIGLLSSIFLVTGCGGELMNTPTKQVESFFTKYQNLDKDVLNDLDKIVAEEVKFNTEQRTKYRDIMKKHYQDLTYQIKGEKVNGKNATITVEITVTDYSKSMQEAQTYLKENPDKFLNDKAQHDESKFTDYRLDKIKNSKEKVKYTFDILLTKENDIWKINELSDSDFEKIHGIYNY